METLHTPGPWFCNGSDIVFLGEGDENIITCERKGVDIEICSVFPQYEFDEDVQTAIRCLRETEANVRLIAIAPELLKCLNSLMLSITAHPDYVSGEEGDEWHDLIENCNEIIEKIKP
jgi:hypothetical protein